MGLIRRSELEPRKGHRAGESVCHTLNRIMAHSLDSLKEVFHMIGVMCVGGIGLDITGI
jgi:hypothetical protein